MPGGGSVRWLLWGIAVVALLWLVDRVFLWMEAREWIYWRRSKGTPIRPGLVRASLELQTLLEPGKRYVLELKNEEKTLADDQGDPPPDRPGAVHHDAAPPGRAEGAEGAGSARRESAMRRDGRSGTDGPR